MINRERKLFLYFVWMLMSVFCTSSTLLAEVSVKSTRGLDKPLPDYMPRLFPSADVYTSRGETASFFLFLKSTSAKKLSATRFFNRKGKKVSGIKVTFFNPQPIYVRENEKSFSKAAAGVYYDPLLPYPKAVKINATNSGKWVLVDVEVSENVKAGRYTASIRYGKKSLPINLRVWKMIIPETPALPLYGEINPIAVDEGHYGQWRENFDVELYKSYMKEIRAHRIYPMRSWPYNSLVAPFDNGQAGGSLDLINTNFFSSMIDGLPRGLKYDLPDMNCYGMGESACSINNLTKTRLNYLKAMEQSIKDYSYKGLVATSFLWDEPFMNAWQWQTKEDYKKDVEPVRKYYKRIKELVPHVKTVITAPCFTDLSDGVDVFISAPNYMEYGYRYGDINFGGRFQDCETLRNRGAETWWYVSCMSHGCSAWDSENQNDDPGTSDFVIERPSSYISSIAWLQPKYKFSAFFYYALVHMYESYPKNQGDKDPWDTVYAHTGQGDGTILFPGRAGEHGLTSHQPIPTIRMKLWRETSFTADYIKWIENLSNKPSWWNTELNNMVSSYKKWNRNYQKYFQMKQNMGKYLNGR